MGYPYPWYGNAWNTWDSWYYYPNQSQVFWPQHRRPRMGAEAPGGLARQPQTPPLPRAPRTPEPRATEAMEEDKDDKEKKSSSESKSEEESSVESTQVVQPSDSQEGKDDKKSKADEDRADAEPDREKGSKKEGKETTQKSRKRSEKERKDKEKGEDKRPTRDTRRSPDRKPRREDEEQTTRRRHRRTRRDKSQPRSVAAASSARSHRHETSRRDHRSGEPSQTNAQVQCVICKKWVSLSGYRAHREENQVCRSLQAKARQRGERTPTPPRTIWYPCELCGNKWFESQYSLGQHLWSKHGVSQPPSNRSRSPSSAGPSASQLGGVVPHQGTTEAAPLRLQAASQVGSAAEPADKSTRVASFLRGVAAMLDP